MNDKRLLIVVICNTIVSIGLLFACGIFVKIIYDDISDMFIDILDEMGKFKVIVILEISKRHHIKEIIYYLEKKNI